MGVFPTLIKLTGWRQVADIHPLDTEMHRKR